MPSWADQLLQQLLMEQFETLPIQCIQSMPHDAHIFKYCGEMMSGWQDSFMFKLALHARLRPFDDRSPVSRRLVPD